MALFRKPPSTQLSPPCFLMNPDRAHASLGRRRVLPTRCRTTQRITGRRVYWCTCSYAMPTCLGCLLVHDDLRTECPASRCLTLLIERLCYPCWWESGAGKASRLLTIRQHDAVDARRPYFCDKKGAPTLQGRAEVPMTRYVNAVNHATCTPALVEKVSGFSRASHTLQEEMTEQYCAMVFRSSCCLYCTHYRKLGRSNSAEGLSKQRYSTDSKADFPMVPNGVMLNEEIRTAVAQICTGRLQTFRLLTYTYINGVNDHHDEAVQPAEVIMLVQRRSDAFDSD